MRGEDTRQSAKKAGSSGSPPHARGRPVETENGIYDLGITPACAGKTQTRDTLFQ